MALPQRIGLLIGAMKAGTTTLFGHVAAHPDIAAAEPKEPHTLSYDRRWRKGARHYARLFQGEGVGWDGSVSYAMQRQFPQVPERAASLDSDVRIVYLVRDPVERIASHYRHMLTAVKGREFFGKRAPLVHPDALDISDYARQLHAYEDRFPKDRILVLPFHQLRDDPAGAALRVWRHLGLGPGPAPAARQNPSRGRRRLRPFWWGNVPIPAEMVQRTARRNRHGPLRPVFWSEQQTDHELSDEQVLHIRDRLADSMAVLRRDYDIDVGRWGLA